MKETNYMTDDIHKTLSNTPNFKTELAAQLAELAPELIADGKVDVVKLQEMLGSDVADSTERFGLFWPGKKRALRAAQEPTTATLRPDFDTSKDWEATKNVFIEGDNLEVLKILQKHYHAKIKMIYIDPPYNTGKDFVYPDNFKEGLETYLEWTRQVTEEGKKVSTNSETEGRYHSNWLNMMYPRLKLARNLLTADGVISISIDDNEVDNLLKLGNEVFGESNFLGCIVWNHSKQTKNDEPFLASNHNYVLLWRRSTARALLRAPRTEENNRNYSNPDGDPRGEWRSGDVRSPSYRATLRYDIATPSGKTIQPPDNGWRWSQDQVLSKIESGEIIFSADETRIIRKIYLADQAGRIAESIWPGEVFGTTRSANAALKELFDGQVYFDTPKPTQLIVGLARLFSQDEDYLDFTVLDFFSGSGTTAEAVMQLNAEDGGQRRHIQVQLPEPTDESSAAHAAGLATIADISRKRIMLASARIESELGSRLDDGSRVTPDLGFRSYRLADTNFSKWSTSSDVEIDELQQHFRELRESSSADEATSDDLLTEILLKQGYSLTEKVTPGEISGLDVRVVGENLVLAYLSEHVKPTLAQLRSIVDEGPARVIVLEDAFQGDDELKTNLAQLCKSKGIELWTA
jgi:adenine-specific DNA-methyltransferase